jgi:hypothetical protein
MMALTTVATKVNVKTSPSLVSAAMVFVRFQYTMSTAALAHRTVMMSLVYAMNFMAL